MRNDRELRGGPAVSRRGFMAAAGGALAMPYLSRAAFAAGPPTLVTSIRSLTNPYHATWNKGGEAFAKSVGLEHVTLVCEGNSEKGVADIRAILSKTGGNCIINSDPNDGPDARPIVEASVKAGATIVTQWNKPANLHPWDYDPNYVCFFGFNGVPYGKAMAEELFKRMGGKGSIVALGGIQSNNAAFERKAGLDQALAANPDIKLLDFQIANWSDTEALAKMNAWLTQYGDDIGGVWSANDTMGLAAVEALRADGRAGEVLVTGMDGTQLAIEAIMKGEMAGTCSWDSYWQGGMGLSIGYNARMGKFDPVKEPKLHREWNAKGVVITEANAKSFYDSNVMATPTIDYADLWGRVEGPIVYEN